MTKLISTFFENARQGGPGDNGPVYIYHRRRGEESEGFGLNTVKHGQPPLNDIRLK